MQKEHKLLYRRWNMVKYHETRWNMMKYNEIWWTTYEKLRQITNHRQISTSMGFTVYRCLYIVLFFCFTLVVSSHTSRAITHCIWTVLRVVLSTQRLISNGSWKSTLQRQKGKSSWKFAFLGPLGHCHRTIHHACPLKAPKSVTMSMLLQGFTRRITHLHLHKCSTIQR